MLRTKPDKNRDNGDIAIPSGVAELAAWALDVPGMAAMRGALLGGGVAAVAVGVSGLFMETHPDPEKAMSDGPNAWPLPKMAGLLEQLLELDALIKQKGMTA